MIQPEAFVLLSLPNATLAAKTLIYQGILALECVTVSAPSQTRDSITPTRDVYLVLRLNSFETPLDPSRAVQCSVSNGSRCYSFLGGSGEEFTVDFREPSEHEGHIREDFDTFDSILAQYAEFWGPQTSPASSRGFGKQEDLRGHVVLVNEESGEIVGELDNQLVLQEDSSLNEKGREKVPVIIEISDDEDARAVFVRAIPPDQEDAITKSASLINYAISGTTNLLVTAITSASSYIIRNSDPYPAASASDSSKSPSEPPPPPPRALVLLTSEHTRKGLATVHAMSGQVVQVSAMTIALVDKMIKRAAGRKAKGKETTSRTTSTLDPGATTPSMGRSRSSSPAPPHLTSDKPSLPPRNAASPQPPPLPPRLDSASSTEPLGTKERLILSADLILSTIDSSTKQILDVGSQQLNAVVEHKYGAEAARSAALLTGTAQNIAIVYIDMRGIGRKALLKRVGKEYVKGRIAKSKEKSSQVANARM